MRARSRDLTLQECPGIAGSEVCVKSQWIHHNTQQEHPGLQLLPVAAALGYNTYFKSLVLTNTLRKDALTYFAKTLILNCNLSRLVLSGLGLQVGTLITL